MSRENWDREGPGEKDGFGGFPDAADKRRDRLKRLVIRIQSNPGQTTDSLVKLLIAWFGLSGRTARGYIDELSRYEFIRQEKMAAFKDGKADPNLDFGYGWFANDSSKEFLK